MTNKAFILQRIGIYAGKPIDPNCDEEVTETLRSEFNIRLPQRRSLNESLAAAISDHEIINLIIQYRELCSD